MCGKVKAVAVGKLTVGVHQSLPLHSASRRLHVRIVVGGGRGLVDDVTQRADQSEEAPPRSQGR